MWSVDMALTTNRRHYCYDTETSDALIWSKTTVEDAWFLHDGNWIATSSHFLAKDMS